MRSYMETDVSEETTNTTTKLIIMLRTSETTAIRAQSRDRHTFEYNVIHIIIFNLNPVDFFMRGFWRSIPAMNSIILNCISCNKKRKAKSSPKSRVHYLSVNSPSPQLTASSSNSSTSSSSSSPPTNSSSVSSTPSLPMAPNESSVVVTHQPSAPSPGLVLFNSEEQSDIVFLVGEDEANIWRFPAHSFIVENASPIFKAIVDSTDRSSAAVDRQITKKINYCKPEIFRIILRHIYTAEISITSVPNALTLFTAGNQFLLNDLCRLCLTFLYDNCSVDNVLEMLSHFSQFSYLRPTFLDPDLQSFVGSGGGMGSPVHCNRQSSIQFADNCDNILNELITRCYYTLDRSAAVILMSDGFANLDHDLVVKILSRDTLDVPSEWVVFESIRRWSCQQCTRQCREMSGENMRAVLGKALYCPRYLTMSVDEFVRGPHASDLLSDGERQALLARLTGDTQVPMPVHLTGRKLDVRRRFVERPSLEGRLAAAADRPSSSMGSSAADSVSANGATGNANVGSNAGIIAKKKSTSKKLLNGLGDLVICVIRLLD